MQRRIVRDRVLFGHWLAADLQGQRCYCPVGWLATEAGVLEEELLHKGAVTRKIANRIAVYLGKEPTVKFFNRLQRLAAKADTANLTSEGRGQLLDTFVGRTR